MDYFGHYGHYVLAFADNLFIATENDQDYTQVVKHLSKDVEVKGLGKAHYYLGFQIEKKINNLF